MASQGKEAPSRGKSRQLSPWREGCTEAWRVHAVERNLQQLTSLQCSQRTVRDTSGLREGHSHPGARTETDAHLLLMPSLAPE